MIVPEGHTIHRLAARHRELFAGQQVQVSSPQGRFAAGAAQLSGHTIADTVDRVGDDLEDEEIRVKLERSVNKVLDRDRRE